MSITKNIATLFQVGYLPAPGTCGSLVAWIVLYLFQLYAYSWYGLATLLLIGISFFVVQRSLQYFHHADPSEIVLDEFVGCFVLFCCQSWNVHMMIIAFVIYRLLDIYKPFGIKKIEKLPGAYGIIADDLVAGIVANIAVQCLCFLV